jgi:primosomal protein N' (replication factor Y)
MMRYANVAVFSRIDNLLTYAVNEGAAVQKGCRVVVPLGQKLATGVVVEFTDKIPEIAPFLIKPIRSVADDAPVLNPEQIKLGLWVSSYYISPPGLVFSAMLSALYKVASKKTITLLRETAPGDSLSAQEIKVVEYLMKRRGRKSDIRDILKETGLKQANKIIGSLEQKGIAVSELSSRTKRSRSEPSAPDRGGSEAEKNFRLTDEQDAGLTKINAAIDSAEYKGFLVFGVTGSGKTEIYIKAAEHAAAKGKKVIVLVPEIFLTPQIMERFRRAFGEKVAIYHSGLDASERLHEWMKMKDGSADVVVGTRSSIFAPFENIGLIIVDEEFDSSYKQESEPRYNGRDVAVYRAKLNNAVVVLGSATPSIETYYNAVSGKYDVIKLDRRVHKRDMPRIKIIDMKLDWNRGMDMFLTDDLVFEMRGSLENNEQAILFMNRRGFSNFIFCKKCGHIEKCPDCNIPLVLHKTAGEVRCHYCDFSKPPETLCPVCGNKLSYSGVGTQRVEDVITKFFPEKRVKRIDIDSMKGSSEYFETYRQIKDREIDILVGTQMLAKGFDFPEVTFVGVVGIDSTLNLPDFRSEERVFQLLVQVAGRTGRGDKNGIVVIQTFNPDAEGIKYVRKYEIEKFYQEQLKIRKALNYPPYSHIIQFTAQDEDYAKGEAMAEKLGKIVEETIAANRIKTIQVLGPSEAALNRLRNRYRFSLMLKGSSRKDLNFTARAAMKAMKGADVIVVVDPVSTL